MKEVTIKVPEEQYRFFMELLQQLGLEATDEETFEVPELHKDIVRNRLKTLNLENLKDWDEVKGKFTFK